MIAGCHLGRVHFFVPTLLFFVSALLYWIEPIDRQTLVARSDVYFWVSSCIAAVFCLLIRAFAIEIVWKIACNVQFILLLLQSLERCSKLHLIEQGQTEKFNLILLSPRENKEKHHCATANKLWRLAWNVFVVERAMSRTCYKEKGWGGERKVWQRVLLDSWHVVSIAKSPSCKAKWKVRKKAPSCLY